MIVIRWTRAKAFYSIMFINQERKLGDRRRSDTVVVLTINDVNEGLDKFHDIYRTSALLEYETISNTPYSELEEKSWVIGLQGEYGHKAET